MVAYKSGPQRESNPWPLRPKRRIIPLDHGANAQPLLGLEPRISSSVGWRLIQLGHRGLLRSTLSVVLEYMNNHKFSRSNSLIKGWLKSKCHLWDLNPRVRTQYSLSVPPWTTRARWLVYTTLDTERYFSIFHEKRGLLHVCPFTQKQHSHAGTRTRVFRVKAEYPNHLDYMGDLIDSTHRNIIMGLEPRHNPRKGPVH